MSYHNKLSEVTHKLNTLKIRVTILSVFTILIWLFNVSLSTSILLSLILIGWSTISVVDIIKSQKLAKKYKKLAKKEDEEVKERLNNIFNNPRTTYSQYSRRKHSQKELDDLFNELLNKMLNEHFNQQRQHHVHQVNVDKLSNAYKLLRLNSNDSVDKIKKTYKTLAIKWHPDKWATSTEQNRTVALRNFKKLQAAYDLIKKDKNIN